MKTLLLGAAILAFGMGAAFAEGNVNAQVKQAEQPRQQAFASSSHSLVWVYPVFQGPAFRGSGFSEGGEQ